METTADSADPRVQAWSPVCQAIALLLGPYAEVVLHDVARDRVLAVWNPMSRRGPGDASLLGELDRVDSPARDVYGPYQKLLADGRRLSSVSAVLRDTRGEPSAVLCVNLDRTPLDQAAALLAGFAAPTETRPEALFEQDWTERVHQIIGSYVRTCGRPLERLGREDRLSILAELDQAGVFAVRRAVPFVAGALKVSRSSLYALLAELKDKRNGS
jgi:D-arginine utilization repressor